MTLTGQELARRLNLKFLRMEKLYLKRHAYAMASVWHHARGILKRTLEMMTGGRKC